MNAYQFGALLFIGMLASYSHAGEPQYQDPPSVATFASTQDSVALQTIRWRVALSGGISTARHGLRLPPMTECRVYRNRQARSPSTQRQALGLTMDPNSGNFASWSSRRVRMHRHAGRNGRGSSFVLSSSAAGTTTATGQCARYRSRLAILAVRIQGAEQCMHASRHGTWRSQWSR
jgi:hypothetical protein